jgi:L-seryl-tRNA(Ser) seleniumtransferase
LCVRKAAGKRGNLMRLAARLRELPRPIIGRIVEKAMWLDMRCLDAADEAEFLAQWNSFDR